jgi:hypothetical protein
MTMSSEAWNPEGVPRVGLYFRFYGENFDPDEVTRRLGIEPTNSFRPGDPLTKSGHGERRSPGWIMHVGRSTFEIDDVLPEFRQRLDVSPHTVRKLCSDLNLNLVIICGVGLGGAEAAPGLYFPTEFLKWVTEMGADLNVDILW